MSFAEHLPVYRQRLDAALTHWLPPADHYPARLHSAMRYAAEGGKRVRPLLVYATGQTLNIAPQALDAAACAVELIHAYSLAHDDLPAMDNDDLRRGRATVHKAYDEATAILVGDSLQTLAFQVLAQDDSGGLSAAQRVQQIALLAEASGSRGMAGGQAIDLQSEGQTLSLPELEALHIHKTGALIRACLRMAACAAPALESGAREALDRAGKCLGLAFQIQDDVLDEEGASATLGKTAGKDKAALKSTYVSVMGLPEAKRRAAALFAEAHTALDRFGPAAEPLRWMARHIEGRAH